MNVSKVQKWLFWIILSFTSAFFAEIPAASDLFPLCHPWGLLVVFPLYGTHILVLGSFLFQVQNITWQRLYLFGILFGLYEAYITKVIWAPNWEPLLPPIGGILPVEMLVIVFFWHPVFAFILPILLCENQLTGSRRIINSLPQNIKNILLDPKRRFIYGIIFATSAGAFQTLNAPSFLHTLSSGILNGGILLILIWWKQRFSSQSFDIKNLLPNKKERHWFLGLLLIFYIGLGLIINPERVPGISGQVTIWVVYLISFLLIKVHKNNKKEPYRETIAPLPLKYLGIMFATFTLFASLIELLIPQAGTMFGLGGWVIMSGTSLFFLITLGVSSIKQLFT